MHRILSLLLLLGAGILSGSELQVLTEALQSKHFWSAVHAAEYLVELNEAPQALESFFQQQQSNSTLPVKRIGIWRVAALQAQSAGLETDLQHIIRQLRSAAFSTEAEPPPDQINALETLFKLRCLCSKAEQLQLKNALNNAHLPIGRRIYSAALLALSQVEGFEHLSKILHQYQDDPVWSGVLLYILQQYPVLPDFLLRELTGLARTQLREPFRTNVMLILSKHRPDSLKQLPVPDETCTKAYVMLITAQSGNIQSEQCQKLLRQMANSGEVEKMIFAAYMQLKYTKVLRNLQ